MTPLKTNHEGGENLGENLSEKNPFNRFYPCQSIAEGRLRSEIPTARTGWGG